MKLGRKASKWGRIQFSIVAWIDAESKLMHGTRWNFGHVSRTIAELQKHLEWLERQPASPKHIRSMKSTWIELNCWVEKKYTMWMQKS